jgi:hypothetical protein
MSEAAQETTAWDRFWRANRLACCVGRGETNYAADIRKPWAAFFRQFQDGDSMLDLGTGNGAVPLIALDYAEQHGLTLNLHGVDSADIDPANHNPELGDKLGKITFHARTSVTDLPFAEASFDFVTSQYGIEYAPLEPAAAEIVRVLRKGAYGQFIVHAEDGVTANAARRELEDIDELLHDIDIFSATTNALILVRGIEESRGKPTSADMERAKAAFDDYHKRLTRLGEIWEKRTAGDVFRTSGDILQHTFQHRHHFQLQQLLDKVDESRDAVIFHQVRLRALLRAAKSADGCTQMEDRFLDLGCSEAATHALHDQSGASLLGWRVSIRR